MRRRVAVVGFVGIVATTAVGGYVAGSRISSPAEVALRTAAPAPSPILVPVERRTLTSDVVTRGTGAFGSPQKLAVASSTVKPGAGIVADVAAAGTQLAEGGLVARASGRPVFVLIGPQPMSRDLGGGSVGADVRQLEESLVRLGFDPGPVDGLYDEGTAAGVAAWYTSQGFAPFTATVEQLAAVRARDAERSIAEIDMYAASDAVANAEASRVAARTSQQSAQMRAAASRRAASSAQAEANAANASADAELALKRSALELSQASAAAAPEIVVAQREVALAEAARETVRLAGLRSVDAAFVAVADADAEVATQNATITAAEVAARNAGLTASARSRVEVLAAEEADRAAFVAGVQVPADEIVFVPVGPVRVSEPLLGVGDSAVGGIVTVTDSTVHVDAAVALADVGLLRPGMAVRIEEPDLGVSASGTVGEVAASPGTNGVDGFHVYARVDVSTPPATLIGASVRLTIPVESTGGEVLAVPVNAVTLVADGTSRVRVSRNGATRPVAVEPELSAQGYVAVKAIDGSLQEGDLVLIGTDRPTPRTGTR
jgi:peptidoglycan hydrolase-like protein with peptidoglycan-binding domain